MLNVKIHIKCLGTMADKCKEKINVSYDYPSFAYLHKPTRPTKVLSNIEIEIKMY